MCGSIQAENDSAFVQALRKLQNEAKQAMEAAVAASTIDEEHRRLNQEMQLTSQAA